jgi:CubicO group peptidase (beta-lactamase class C family)
MTRAAIHRLAHAVLAAIAALLVATSQPGTQARAALAGDQTMSQIVTAWAQRNAVQQFSVAVWRDGKVVESLGYGGWDPSRPYPIASLSKAVTAVCIADLVQQHKLSFDDTLGHVLAGYFQQSGDPSDPKFTSITIEQLLTHRSGMVRNPAGYATSMADAVRNTTHTMLTARSPSYSNGGY